MIFRATELEAFAGATGGEYVHVNITSRRVSRFHVTLARTPAQEALSYIIPEMGFAKLPNVVLKGAHAVIFSPAQARYVVHRMSHRDYNPLWDADDWTRATAEGLEADLDAPQIHIKEPAFLFGLCNNNYGHFVWEGLMRAFMLSRIPGNQALKIIVPDNLPKRFNFWFEAMGIAADRLIPIPALATVAVNTLYACTAPFGRASDKTPLIHEQSLHFARHSILGGKAPRLSRQRLYFSRADCRDKRLVNEADVLALLEPDGFRVLTGTDTTPEEQLELVRSAETIIAPIGAATAVAAFAPEDCMIVEMTPERSIFGIFNATMSSLILGQPFARLTGSRVILPDNPRPEPLWWDYGVDLGVVRSVLDAVLFRPKFEI